MKAQDKFRGCLLGLAIGDSSGVPLERFHTKKAILKATNGMGVLGPPDPALISDDTQMSVAVAEALIEAGDSDGFMKSLTQKFIEWRKQQDDPKFRRGPGNTCLRACENLMEGRSWEESGIPGSLGCGSAMRSAPIGLFFDKIEKVIDCAINSSIITHPHELCLCGAVGTAVLTHLALNDEPMGIWASELVRVNFSADFKDIIKLAAKCAAERQDPDVVLSDAVLGEGWTGHEAVASALYCCMMFPNSYEKAVLLAANTVGDSDSIACITGAWMGCRLGVEAIPKEWIEKIENRDQLIDLADRLLERTGL